MNIREQVQQKAKEIGHCLCSPVFTCPCEFFKRHEVCKCANEKCEEQCNLEDWIKINLNN